MEKSNPAAGNQPATGGGSSTPDTSSGEQQPIRPFGANAAGAGSDVTVNFKCKLTLKNGAALFGGVALTGNKPEGADGASTDVVLEVEGSATVSGAETLFGGAVVGGRLIGSGDQSGGGGKQQQSPVSQSYDAAQGRGGSAGG